MEPAIELGMEVEDTVTGFTGKVTALHQYIGGYKQVTVEAMLIKIGERLMQETFELTRLRPVVVSSEPAQA